MCRLPFLVAIVILMTTKGQCETKNGMAATILIGRCAQIADNHTVTHIRQNPLVQNRCQLDATDYIEVKRQLDRASKSSFAQRLAEWFRSDPDCDSLHQRSKPRLSLNVGVRYRVEVGVMPTAVIGFKYKKYYARLALAASFNGCYGVGFVGRKFIWQDRSLLECEIDAGRLAVRFWGLGYDAAVSNPRTIYDRLACNLKVALSHRVARNFRIAIQFSFRNREAQSMSDQGLVYLKSVHESLTSLQCGLAAVTAEYDSRHYANSTPQGGYIRVEQEIIPKLLSSDNLTKTHFSMAADFYQTLWSGGLGVLSVECHCWSKSTPWLLWPSVGSSERMRGYRYGRYLARNMISTQIVVRQRIYGSLWGEAWGGAAQLFQSIERVKLRHTLPAYGIGARLELPNLFAISVGYGFGRRADGLMVNISEKF